MMKKLLAITLALALCLSLAVPALAVGPEPHILEEMAIEGVAQERENRAAYEAAHPEEIAALDVDKLLADWGYEDISVTAEEQFIEYKAEEGETLEEAVKREYIDLRLLVEEICADAAAYRAEYPQEWENFDANVYFEEETAWAYESKTAYMAEWCIFTEEEFVDDMFVAYIDDYDNGDDGDDWDYIWDEPQEEPTLTLMVNGVASDVAVTAADGVSYADAAQLRTILGDKAVAADAAGNVAIRPAAEAAGWDVAWYGGGWRGVDQEIQLWDKAAFEAELADQFGPFNDLMAQLMKSGMDRIFSETPVAGHETVNVDLTRFSTLDGNRSYTLTLAADYVIQKGVADVTLTFDVSQLLGLFDAGDLAAMTKEGGFTVDQLTGFLKAGKLEMVLDYNENAMAYNFPLLALLDEDLAGWQVIYSGSSSVLPEVKEWEEISFVSSAYAQMLSRADYLGAEDALGDYRYNTQMAKLFLGKDRFSTQNGKTTYSITAQDVNRVFSTLAAQATGKADVQVSLFKNCELTVSVDANGYTTMAAHVRPDMEGIAAASALDSEDDYDRGFTATGLKWLLPALYMDLTASSSGNQNQSNGHVNIHWNNVGSLEMRAQTTAASSGKGPRQIADLDLPAALAPDDELDPGFNMGLIGGADGPTAVFTTR